MASYHSVWPLPSSSYHSPSPDFVPDSWHGMSAGISTFRSLLFHPVTLISAGMFRQYRIIKNCKPINISELSKVILENLLEHLPPFNRSQTFKVMGWKTFAWRTNVYKNGPFLHFKTLSYIMDETPTFLFNFLYLSIHKLSILSAISIKCRHDIWRKPLRPLN